MLWVGLELKGMLGCLKLAGREFSVAIEMLLPPFLVAVETRTGSILGN